MGIAIGSTPATLAAGFTVANEEPAHPSPTPRQPPCDPCWAHWGTDTLPASGTMATGVATGAAAGPSAEAANFASAVGVLRVGRAAVALVATASQFCVVYGFVQVLAMALATSRGGGGLTAGQVRGTGLRRRRVKGAV